MKKFEEQKFTIPKLKGISEKNIEEPLNLRQLCQKRDRLWVNTINLRAPKKLSAIII